MFISALFPLVFYHQKRSNMNNAGFNLRSVFFLVVLFFSITTSCNSVRRTTSGNKMNIDVRRSLIVRLDRDRYPDNVLLENADFRFESDKNVNGKFTLYLKKDKLIFLSVRWMGFEAARLLLTPDSVRYIDRFNSRYYFSGSSVIFKNGITYFDFNDIQNFIYSGIFVPGSMNTRELSNLFEFVDSGLRYVPVVSNNATLELFYPSDNLFLSKLNYLDNLEQISLTCYFDRPGNELKELNAILIHEGHEKKLKIRLNGISDKEFNKMEFKIGKNYLPLENLPF